MLDAPTTPPRRSCHLRQSCRPCSLTIVSTNGGLQHSRGATNSVEFRMPAMRSLYSAPWPRRSGSWLSPVSSTRGGRICLRFCSWRGGHVCLNILAHESAHRLLFSKRRANDLCGRWLLGYPSFQPTLAYRRSHFAHHRDEMGRDEPDLAMYSGYPIPRGSWHRKLRRDLLGITGYKRMKQLAPCSLAWRC